MQTYDAIIIGAGHNGLTCAAYLGRAGLRVKVVERRAVVGGAAVTAEFYPGFRNSVAAYTVSLLNPKVIADLALARHGLKIVERRAQNFVPAPDGRYLLAADGRMEQELAKFSANDAERYAAFNREIDAVADVLRRLVLEPPPNLTAGFSRRSLRRTLQRARRRQQPAPFVDGGEPRAARPLHQIRRAIIWMAGSRANSSKRLFGFDAVVGNYASPYTPGTAYVMLHHAFGEVNGKKRRVGPRHRRHGRDRCRPRRAPPASTASRSRPRPACAKSSSNATASPASCSTTAARCAPMPSPRTSIRSFSTRKLMPADALPANFRERMERWRCGSGTFRMNVALSQLPRFTALPEADDHLTAGIILAPSLAYMDRAYHDARAFGWSREPIIEMLIPSTLDDSLAPPGAHVASLFCQHVAPQLPDGKSWDDHRDDVADLMIATVERYAPGFAASILGRQILTPLDLERDFGLLGGDIFHGALTLDQLFSARPMLGHADYRGPLAGLYHCGAGAHPGGGVTGAPGHNAARVILGDLRRVWHIR